jgi:hypothetical protein
MGGDLGQPFSRSGVCWCLAETTLRGYALDFLHFLRWWVNIHQTDTVTEKALTEATLLEYVRFQAGRSLRLRPPPSTAA